MERKKSISRKRYCWINHSGKSRRKSSSRWSSFIRRGNSDVSALTGESLPKEVEAKDDVLAGSINKSGLLKIKVTKSFGESTVSKILDLVENAGNKNHQQRNL